MDQREYAMLWHNQTTPRAAWFTTLFRYWGNPWLACLWLSGLMAAILLSVVPGNWISLTRHFPDLSPTVADAIEPLSHFFGYAILVGFVCAPCRRRTTIIWIYIAAIFIGIMIEMAQVLLPQRGASFADLSMNVLGASAGFVFGVARLKRNTRTPRRTGLCK